MQKELGIRRLLLLSFFIFSSFIMFAGVHTNFLPMEDGYFASRGDEIVYGASIESTRPYRQPVALDHDSRMSDYTFGSTDLLVGVFLLGVYFVFTHKRTKTRNINL